MPELAWQLADGSGRVFRNYLDYLSYGHTEVMRLLKARNDIWPCTEWTIWNRHASWS